MIILGKNLNSCTFRNLNKRYNLKMEWNFEIKELKIYEVIYQIFENGIHNKNF